MWLSRRLECEERERSSPGDLSDLERVRPVSERERGRCEEELRGPKGFGPAIVDGWTKMDSR